MLGNITMIPVRAASSIIRAASYQDGEQDLSGFDIEQAVPLHQID